MNLGVFGATGQVGFVMRQILTERKFPIDSIRFFASSRSAGRKLAFQGNEIEVEDSDTANFEGMDIALFSCGAVASRVLAPKVAAGGAVVIDNSSAWRMDSNVPLVVPEVNGHALSSRPLGIVANPNCTTMIAMSTLKALDKTWGLGRVVASTYQAVSGAGLAGVEELAQQIYMGGERLSELTFSGSAVSWPEAKVFPGPIAANVIPQAGSWEGDVTTEELKFRDETRKILELPSLGVFATCVRVPVFTGHSLSLNIELKESYSLRDVIEAVASAPGVSHVPVPTPLASSGSDQTLVGRIRRDDTVENGVGLFISGDNLRKGAALNAVQIAEALI